MSNTTGENNTAIGSAALFYNATGFVNTAVGILALQNNTTGSFNTALGFDAGTSQGDNNIFIGSAGPPVGSNMIRIGQQSFYHNLFGFDHNAHTATFIAGITAATIPLGTAVVIDGNGQLGVATSSARFKTDIKPMEKASETILALKPVTFRYTKDIDSKGTPQYGLVAEEVEKINQDLVVHDAQGKPYTVRYDAVNAMLLNEFLKAHRKTEEQQATIEQLKSNAANQGTTINELKRDIGTLRAQFKEQASRIEKVTAQLKMSRAPLKVVAQQ